jgi:integrase/recombinase XerD
MFILVDNDVIVKLVEKIEELFPTINTYQLREILDATLEEYDITKKELSLVKSDIPEHIHNYLVIRKLDGLSENTLENYKRVLTKFSQMIIKPMSAITTTDVRMFLALYQQRGIKQTTMTMVYDSLHTFFDFEVREEYIVKNPMDKIKRPSSPKKLRESLSIEDLEKLRYSCKDIREKAIIEVLSSSGLRVSELSNLKVNDINWKERSIKVIEGKGKKDRITYFSPRAELYIQEYIKTRQGKDQNTSLFVSKKYPYDKIGSRAMEKVVSNIGNRVGIHVYPHLLRHGFCTNSLKSSVPLAVVSKLMGHTNLATTQVYVTMNEDMVKNEYNKYAIK